MKLRLWNLLPHDYAPFFRILHIIVAFLILSQIINSNLTETEAIGEHSLEGVITWMHIISGLGLIICGFIMLSWMLTQRGFTYYFSYEILSWFLQWSFLRYLYLCQATP